MHHFRFQEGIYLGETTRSDPPQYHGGNEKKSCYLVEEVVGNFQLWKVTFKGYFTNKRDLVGTFQSEQEADRAAERFGKAPSVAQNEFGQEGG